MADYPEKSLGWWIERQRAELRLTIAEVAERAGVSDETLRMTMRGRKMRPVTRRGVETALHWAAGSIDAIERGGAPTVLIPGPTHSGSIFEEQERLLRSVITHMEQTGVPTHAIRDFLIRVAAELTERSTERGGETTAS